MPEQTHYRLRDQGSRRLSLNKGEDNNSLKEQFALGDFRRVMMETVVDGLENYQSMAGQVLGNQRVRDGFAVVLLDIVYEALRTQIRYRGFRYRTENMFG